MSNPSSASALIALCITVQLAGETDERMDPRVGNINRIENYGSVVNVTESIQTSLV